MNYFPNGEEEISLIKFLAKYQYLHVNDSKHFFSTKRYYRNRVNNLISKRFIKKSKFKLFLDELGIEYAKLFQFEYNKRSKNYRYQERLLYLSSLGAFYHNCNTVTFIPSFSMKDKQSLTTTARRFIGILEINGYDYLTYHISKNHDNRYITSVIYDIQKEKKYKNIIILVDDITRINMTEFAFGMNNVLIIEDNEQNREKLKYLNSINWSKLLQNNLKNKVVLAEYNFCDYTDHKSKYVSTFYFFNAEKINRIKCFLRENKNKNADIVCSSEIKDGLQKELPTANYVVVDLEEYIDKELNVYD